MLLYTFPSDFKSLKNTKIWSRKLHWTGWLHAMISFWYQRVIGISTVPSRALPPLTQGLPIVGGWTGIRAEVRCPSRKKELHNTVKVFGISCNRKSGLGNEEPMQPLHCVQNRLSRWIQLLEFNKPIRIARSTSRSASHKYRMWACLAYGPLNFAPGLLSELRL